MTVIHNIQETDREKSLIHAYRTINAYADGFCFSSQVGGRVLWDRSPIFMPSKRPGMERVWTSPVASSLSLRWMRERSACSTRLEVYTIQ